MAMATLGPLSGVPPITAAACFLLLGVPVLVGAKASTGARLPSGLTTYDVAFVQDDSIFPRIEVACSIASSTLI